MEDFLLQGEYLREQLQKGLERIFEAQRIVASRKLNQKAAGSRSSQLMRSLVHPEYRLTARPGAVHGMVRYPREIRFQDMRHLGNWRIYNRQIWRILYKETFADIRYEFSDWLRARVVNSLSQAFHQ